MAAPLILVEAQPRRTDTGATVTVRLAGGGGVKPYRYSGHGWRAGLTGLPRIIAAIDFRGDDLGTGSVPQAMVLRWAPARSSAVAELAAYHWTDADITVRIGPEGTLPPVLLSGKVLEAPSDNGALSIALADPAADLKKPLLTERFAGTGGIEGPAEWEGRIKSRAWGRIFNAKGEPIDQANNIYCFGDPTRRWQAFDAVRDKGAAAAALTTLAWQGSAAATFTALQAAEAPDGGGVACPSIACVKWWTEPAGSLCADLRGEIGAGYVETAPAIAERVAAVVSTVAFAAGTVAGAAAARPIAVGWLVEDENTTAANVIDQLLGDVSLIWVLDDDEVVIRAWEWGESVASARTLGVRRREAFKPVSKRKLGYRRNQHKMTRDSIAAIVLATDVQFLDGTPIEDLKPAEGGATRGAIVGAGPEQPGTVFDLDGNELDRGDLVTAEGTSADTGAVAGRPAPEVLDTQDGNTLAAIAALGAAAVAKLKAIGATYPPGFDGSQVDAVLRSHQLKLGDHTASLSEVFSLFLDESGAIAAYTFAIDLDGRIVGWRALTGESGSLIDYMADAVRFLDPATGDPMIWFDVGAGEIIANGLRVDRVQAGSITGTGLDTGSMGKAGVFYRDASIGIDNASYTDVASVTLTPDYGKPIFINFSCFARCTDDNSTPCYFRVRRDDGTVIWGSEGDAGRQRVEDEGRAIPITCFDGSVQGRATTWTVQARRISGGEHVDVSHRALIVTEMSRLNFETFDVTSTSGTGPADGAAGGGGIGTYNPNQELPQP